MSKLGPKCQYFVWPPLFSSTALTLLGMEFTRALQVTTGVLFHSSMTTSQSWWMLETLCSSTFCLRMPHRCSIGFRSGDMLGQSITFTLSFFSRAAVVIMLEYCPVAQSPKGGDHALLQYVTVHVGIHGSLNELLAPDHDTPTHFSLYSSPGCCHTYLTPSEQNKLILVSSDHRKLLQQSMSLVCLSSANCLRTFLCIILRQPCRPILCSVLHMVWALTGWHPTPSTSAAMLAALIRLFPKHNLWIWRGARALNFSGRPWRGLFWVKPVPLNSCMVLANMLQFSFSFLAIFL